MNYNEFFQALNHPCRREILGLLRAGEMSAGEIAAHFSISQPSISRHLDLLRRSGLVASRRAANQIIYSLNSAALREGSVWLKEFLEKTEEY